MKYKLEVSGHVIPSTALICCYLNMLMNLEQTHMQIALVQRNFKDHFQINGPDVEFTITIEYVHVFMELSLLDMETPVTPITGCDQ